MHEKIWSKKLLILVKMVQIEGVIACAARQGTAHRPRSILLVLQAYLQVDRRRDRRRPLRLMRAGGRLVRVRLQLRDVCGNLLRCYLSWHPCSSAT